jgi:hypothetical protein
MSANANEPAPEPRDRPMDAGSAPISAHRNDRRGPARWLVALAGLLAGLAAFGIGEAAYNCIPPRLTLQNTMGRMLMAVNQADAAAAETRNAALAFAILGGCLAGLLGVAGGLARRSGATTAAAGLLGLLIGAGVAAGVSLATLPSFTYARLTYSDYEMVFSMVMHGGIWGLSGAVAGLAFAAGQGLDDRRFLVLAPIAGFIGAVIGALAFELVGAGLFPLAYTGDPVSADWPSRLTARMLVALGTAAGVILCLPERS